MKKSVIIPFRGTSTGRVNNLLFVLEWLSGAKDMEVVVVEQDARSKLGDVRLPGNCSHVFTVSEREFNKAWACNVGFRHASGRVLAIADADMFMDLGFLQRCFEQCAHDFEAVKPYGVLVDLSPAETVRVLGGDAEGILDIADDRRDRRYRGEFLNFCGGIFVIRADAYQRVGGFDERFLGWGGEDDAMAIKLKAFVPNTTIHGRQVAYHLHHPSARPGFLWFNRGYRANLRLLRQYRAMSRAQLQELCGRQRQSMGDTRDFWTG